MPDLDNLLKVKERLADVKIYNKDYAEVVKKYKGSDSFFYLDPPYPGLWPGGEVREESFSIDELLSLLKTLKGKFILSLNKSNKNRRLFKDFNIKTVTRLVTFTRPEQQEDPHHRSYDKEFLISNFHLKTINLYIEKADRREDLASMKITEYTIEAIKSKQFIVTYFCGACFRFYCSKVLLTHCQCGAPLSILELERR